MKYLFIFLFSNLVSISFAGDWSDTMDMLPSGIFTFTDNSGPVGYKQDDEIVINPRFEDGFNFHCEYASAKFDGKWGVINKKGKWKIKPEYEMIAPVISDNYIAYKDSIFSICNLNGTKTELGYFLKIDFNKYMQLLKLSHDPEKDLVIRVMQMYDIDRAHSNHRDPGKAYCILSSYLIQYYWSAKWAISQLMK